MVGGGAVGSAQGLVQMRSWVGCGVAAGFPGGEGLVRWWRRQRPVRLSGQVPARRGGAMTWSQSKYSARAWQPGNRQVEVAGFDGVADVVGDAVFDGSHGGELAGDRVGDQASPAGVGTGAQVAGDLRSRIGPQAFDSGSSRCRRSGHRALITHVHH